MVTSYFHTPVSTVCMYLLLCVIASLIRKCLESILTDLSSLLHFIGDPIFFQLITYTILSSWSSFSLSIHLFFRCDLILVDSFFYCEIQSTFENY